MSHNPCFKHKQYELILKIPVFHKNPQLKKPIYKNSYSPFPYCFLSKTELLSLTLQKTNSTKNPTHPKNRTKTEQEENCFSVSIIGSW